MRVLISIYGCSQADLLWYELYMELLQKLGFTINQYDLCVANAMIDGSQCSIQWHVDDTKISHVDKNFVTIIIF